MNTILLVVLILWLMSALPPLVGIIRCCGFVLRLSQVGSSEIRKPQVA
jgi:hypothetical protein